MVMVIAALAFVGIIVGALLTAVGYSYRLKLQDLNSRDNFYYVEQAMNEIYAGVGSEVVEDMQDAYIATVENMVYYDLETKAYVTKPRDVVQKEFEEKFMENVQGNELFQYSNLGDTLESYISNKSVELDRSKLLLDVERDGSKITKITIKNVTLTRTHSYERNVASGSYTQTISTDIEIGEPDFDVLFNATNEDYANIFKYSMVADMGIEVNQPSRPLTITGNIYAASDYYNKKYNESTYALDDDGNYIVSDEDKKFESGIEYVINDTDENGDPITVTKSMDEYTHGSVTSKKYHTLASLNTYYNKNAIGDNSEVEGSFEYFDGVFQKSMYSGFYIDGSSVNVMADMVIVPGTVAVMNEGTFSMYGKSGDFTSKAELWADNIYLGGTSDRKEVTESGKTVDKFAGSSALLKANAYIKDDTELKASGSTLSLNGNYYGYGDSTEKDERIFVPSVNAENFQVTYTLNGREVTENRGHYNSSAIIINGEQSTLDLSLANTIYLAGRSYIELSKDVNSTEAVVGEGADAKNVVTTTYSYMPKGNNFMTEDDTEDTVFIRDYKSGESITVKSNQYAYVPVMFTGMPEPVYDEDGAFEGYFEAELHPALKNSELFNKYFPVTVFDDYKIPTVMQEISGKRYYYYDFKEAYDIIAYAYNNGAGDLAAFSEKYPSAQYLASAFLVDYVKELKDESSAIRKYLVDIGNFEDYDPGQIILPDYENNDNVNIYSSGALTTKTDTEFNIVSSPSWTPDALSSLLSSTEYDNGLSLSTMESVYDGGVYSSAYQLSNDFELEYNLVKWNLGHYEASDDENKNTKNLNEINYIKELVQDADYGEASITPINKFMNMDEITSSTNIVPALSAGDAGSGVLKLNSGYSVWVSNDDVSLSTSAEDGYVRGIVVTKGDVYFDSSVKSFEGLIVSGGKIFIESDLSKMYSSPAICQAILRECQLLGTEEANLVLNLFKGYEIDEDGEGGSSEGTPESPTDASDKAKTIDNIDYSDVCRFNNWMKNVE